MIYGAIQICTLDKLLMLTTSTLRTSVNYCTQKEINVRIFKGNGGRREIWESDSHLESLLEDSLLLASMQ